MTIRKTKRGRRANRAPVLNDPHYVSGTVNIDRSIDEVNQKLVDTAALMADEEQAREHVMQMNEASFMSRHGGKFARVEAKHDQLQRELAQTEAELADARHEQAQTKEWKSCSAANQTEHEEAKKETPYSGWSLPHRVEVPILIIMLLVAITASYFTAYANLRGSGAPIFIETPIAWLMAAMAPLAGLTLKLFGNLFTTDLGHRRYTLILFFAAILLAVAWAALFALLYHGLSADGLGGDIFAEPTLWDELKDTAFVFTTILTEIFIGAALASRLDRIARVYAPDHRDRTPDFVNLKRAIAKLEKRQARLTDKRGKLEKKRTPLRSGMELQSGAAMVAFNSRRERFANTDLI